MEALLTAAAQVLVRHGYENATTARIAERAGVSIGSLYQYFPNKVALVAALTDRHAHEIVEINRRALEGPEANTLEGGVRAAIRAGIAAHRLDPALHKILVEQVPRTGRIGKAMRTGKQIGDALAAFMEQHRKSLRPGLDPAVAAQVMETAVEALTHRFVIDQPAALSQKQIEDETLDLAMRYLLPNAAL